MSPGLIIGGALAVGILILVTSIGIGLLGYKPERAEAIRRGEASDPVIIEEVRRIHVAPPDRFRRGRIDRHPYYLGVLFSTMIYALCILAGAPVTSNLTSLDERTRYTMAGCYLIGAVLALAGAAMGVHWKSWDLVPGIRDHIASSRLGDDVRLPYTFGFIAMVTVACSNGIYAKTSFGSTIGSLGGWLTAGLSAVSIFMACAFYFRTRQYSRTLKVIVDEAVATVIARGNHVD